MGLVAGSGGGGGFVETDEAASELVEPRNSGRFRCTSSAVRLLQAAGDADSDEWDALC